MVILLQQLQLVKYANTIITRVTIFIIRQKTPVEIEEQRRLEDIGEYSPETKETIK